MTPKRPSRALSVVSRRPKRCRQTPAGSSTCARPARCSSGRCPVTAACSARTRIRCVRRGRAAQTTCRPRKPGLGSPRPSRDPATAARQGVPRVSLPAAQPCARSRAGRRPESIADFERLLIVEVAGRDHLVAVAKLAAIVDPGHRGSGRYAARTDLAPAVGGVAFCNLGSGTIGLRCPRLGAFWRGDE
jgi:hypothetical protein